MELFKKVPNYKFMKNKWYAIIFTTALLVISVMALVLKGREHLGIDFVGGSEIILQFDKSIKIDELRSVSQGIGLGSATIQQYDQEGRQFSIKDKKALNEEIEKIKSSFSDNKITLLSNQVVGPLIGKQIASSGIKAFIWGLFVIFVYVSIRFEWPFAFGAIFALFHDAVIVLGAYIVAGHEFNGHIIASILTIVGYSVNDTVIIFDRIRENLGKIGLKDENGNKATFSDIIDISTNETLSRTLITSGTIFISALGLLVFGKGVIKELGFAFTVGTLIGTYSSIFVASPIADMLRKFKKN